MRIDRPRPDLSHPPTAAAYRVAAIADLNDDPSSHRCGATCLYGQCNGSPWPGCGGCCRCLGGCQVDYERLVCAPYTNEGDDA